MVGEAVGVLKDAAANHKAVNFGVFFMKFEGVGAIFDVAIDDEFGCWRDLVAKRDDIWDEFIMSGDFAHFFFGTEVDGECGGMFGE